MARTQRIGIYSGTFNPVHAGHISFALQVMKTARLDRLYFLPERRPRHKKGIEHFGHRVAMLKQACRPHPKFEVLELDDVSFSIKRTLPKLETMFASDRLVFLFGSDVAEYMGTWDYLERLFATSELVVGMRHEQDTIALKKAITTWPIQPLRLQIIESIAADVSSGKIRTALQARKSTHGLLASVLRYSERNWLYVSLAKSTKKRLSK